MIYRVLYAFESFDGYVFDNLTPNKRSTFSFVSSSQYNNLLRWVKAPWHCPATNIVVKILRNHAFLSEGSTTFINTSVLYVWIDNPQRIRSDTPAQLVNVVIRRLRLFAVTTNTATSLPPSVDAFNT